MNERETRRIFAEEAVLSALLISEGRQLQNTPYEVDDFSGFRKKIFGEICLQVENCGTCDPACVASSIGYAGEISRILNLEIISGSLARYVGILNQLILEEKTDILREKAKERIGDGDDPVLICVELSAEIDDLRSRYGNHGPSKNDLDGALDEVFQQIQSGRTIDSLEFGFPPVDRLIIGLLPGEYLILAARPSCGKTAFSLHLMRCLAERQIRSFLFSLEMGPKALFGRILAQLSGVDTRLAIRQPNRLSEEVKNHLLSLIPEAKRICSFINVSTDPVHKFQAIRARAKRAVKEGAKILILDYLQLLEGVGINRNTQVEYISRSWKNLLKELKVPGIMLSQLSRKCEEENRIPQLSDLRDSGSIEQDADIVWFLSKPPEDKRNKTKPDPRLIHLIQAKGRDHGTAFTNLFFEKKSQTFFEIENSGRQS
jgi:replicative DNA helicase